MRLADSTNGQGELNIDLLVGADYNWQFMNGRVIRGGASDPVAVSTKLGFVLSGPVGKGGRLVLARQSISARLMF